MHFKDIEPAFALGEGKRAADPERFIRSYRSGEKKHSFVSLTEGELGAHGAEEIPVPIPNTEVKLSSGDYTAKSGKLARCRIVKGPSE